MDKILVSKIYYYVDNIRSLLELDWEEKLLVFTLGSEQLAACQAVSCSLGVVIYCSLDKPLVIHFRYRKLLKLGLLVEVYKSIIMELR